MEAEAVLSLWKRSFSLETLALPHIVNGVLILRTLNALNSFSSKLNSTRLTKLYDVCCMVRSNTYIFL